MGHILQCHDIFKTDFVRAENCYVYDSQGRQYLDLESGIWCTALGHNRPRILQAMQAQMEKVIHLGTRYPNGVAEAAALDVLKIVGMDQGKCVFLSSGSEAVEFGVQAARRVSGKPLLLTFTSSYLAAYGSAGRKSADEWCLLDWNACGSIDQCLQGLPFEQIGGFIFEPGGSGSGFVKFPPQELVHALARRIQEAGGLLMANEITAGMGRTGRWFGFQHYDFQPDIVALGKGLGNGYPVSAVAIRQDIAEALEDNGFHYAQSHQNDPLGCAVARQVITEFRAGSWVERGNEVGGRFLDGLKDLVGKHPVIKEARGRGMLLGLEFHPHETITAEWAYRALLDNGFLVGYYPAGNMLRFDPALTIEEQDLTRFIQCLEAILQAAE